mmetsp:Transcript_26352/g.43773  ORF Transcript_26352/g.43773 Transcript_26352/m.43773 type:complete len:317 (-) Transcript_26352:337-1287(-)|eukprot:CAMPEP_0119319410 /NCGR_PEP_ID=MMETSP1333-20130426/49281_1 /TAXON_ID=418940 /ORGANISM="Scyphosphaera apsteinii, Strain RCC1455" /LENGTH=316 /DNA_ID=CAMNT_0007325809 /DNA_START=132 /DNA_END=1082 /DNA_ORIENTATION=-
MDPKKTQAMEIDVAAMEQRLSALRANMAAERDRRDQSRRSNPTGSTWKSSRTDVPVSSAGGYVKQVLAPQQSDQQQRLRQPRWAAKNPLVTESGAQTSMMQGVGTAAADATASRQVENGSETLYEWNPGAAVDQGGNEFADLLGPEPDSCACRSTKKGFGSTTMGMSTGTGGSLLEGEYDEAASAGSFQDALMAWRNGGATTASAAATPVARTCTAKSAQRPSLMDCVVALSKELGLDSGLTLAEAVASANKCVGIEPQGSLTEQVDRLIDTTGVKVPLPVDSRAQTPSGPPQATQTSSMNYYERLMEQKRKDGVM